MAVKTTVRDATLDLLRSLGMTTVFGNPGSTELAFLNQWPGDIRYILGLQESSVVAMADGYARSTGNASFVNLHSAAGLGHSLGSVFTAFRNRAPLVITAGQQARELMPNLPYLGATEAATFPKPYVKYSVEPAQAEDVPAAIAHAYRVAMQRPQGPTFVSVPSDDWSKSCLPVEPRVVSRDFAPDPVHVEAAAAQIGAARRPVIVVGAEVDEERAGPSVVELAEKMNAPVMTAPFSSRISMPEDHPLFSGFLPASPAVLSETLMSYDLVVVVGAPVFTFHVPGDAPLLRSGIPIIHLTTDGEAAASAPAGSSILGSLRFTLPALTAAVAATDRPAPPLRERSFATRSEGTISAAYLLRCLDLSMPEKTILVEEAPSLRRAMQEQMTMREWGSFLTMASGGLGYGLPAAVGVALARPDRKVVCLIGDGSYMYSPQALWTAAQHGLNLSVIVANNKGYGAMRAFKERLQIRDIPGIEISGLDFVGLAKSMGGSGFYVESAEEVEDAVKTTLSMDGPSVLEVLIDY